ncbi:MAG TPA: helix-turn-helix transcriptional regulator [Sedimentisphaerales bacterium]|nr:helix-turn-helix transcriptional regulator [Sedimentisphaerales bacterium]
MGIVKDIGQAIKTCGKTRYQISKETGIDQATLCRIVNGGRCGMKTADKLCEYLGLELRPRRAKGR